MIFVASGGRRDLRAAGKEARLFEKAGLLQMQREVHTMRGSGGTDGALMIRSYREEGTGRPSATDKDADNQASSSSEPPSET
jgi:hypothetical protein